MKESDSQPVIPQQEAPLHVDVATPSPEEVVAPAAPPTGDPVMPEEENLPPEGDAARELPEESDDGRGLVGSFQDILGKIIHKGESGIKRATDLKIPKEVIAYGKEQMGSLRKEMVGIVGNEVKSFLGSINLGQELVKIFTYLTFEVKMQIRLVPSEKGGLVIQPKTEVKLVDSNKEKGG
ncbi:hypothetical protein KKF84_09565 [Myxococcota bacterium]|nr:hypothetical protein [Myxococcota bacterium]MBU1535558.1 hypothetical protein [Myxococcota bacterium]